MASVVNFYSKLPKGYIKKQHNPSYNKLHIELPFRMLICGASGSGKSNAVYNLLHYMNETFERIVICCRSTAEPLYDFIKEKAPDVEFYENDVPDVESFRGGESNQKQSLVLFDDLVNEKAFQSKILEFFIRARKYNCSLVYLSQIYHKTPKDIRLQCNYFILMKNAQVKDLRLILSDFNVPEDVSELRRMYVYATEKSPDARDSGLGFLMLDMQNPRYRIRSGFSEVLSDE